jgi:acetate kinase
MKVLVCNAGSSSLKFSLFEANEERLLADGGIDWAASPTRLVVRRPGQPDLREELSLRKHADAVSHILTDLTHGTAAPLQAIADVQAVGHRVVHGGDRYTQAVRITPEVKKTIAELAELAPLHNPAALDGINAAEAALPGVPQVAAFDTAFHATLSEAARTYPVPFEWQRDWGIRRYGFHGLSHSYCAARAAEMLHRNDLRLVSCHLGNGASLAAVRNGLSVDTTMGFTPLEGLMMGTRSGTVDPGILIYLLRHKGATADSLDHTLNFLSGLKGVSGVSSDLRQVLAAADGNARARLAMDVYVHRIRRLIGAMTASLGGVDALVFTAGVGENSAEVRSRVCTGLEYLGVELDHSANEGCHPDADVAGPGSRVRILVIATREDLTVVREVRRLLSTRITVTP